MKRTPTFTDEETKHREVKHLLLILQLDFQPREPDTRARVFADRMIFPKRGSCTTGAVGNHLVPVG